MQHHILIVGKSFSGIKAYLSERGYDFTVLQDRATTKFPDKKFKNRIVVDFTDQDSILSAVNALHAKKPIDGLLATYEQYIRSTADIAHHLGLPGLSREAAAACTDKELMRQKFALAPEKISPAFKAVSDENELLEFARNHHFPLILKPANLSKSLLVTKNSSHEELLANYQKAIGLIGGVYKKYAPNSQPKLIVEEFLEGPIFSVDAFVDASGEPHVLDNVVDYQTGYDIGFDDNFHYSRILPSRLSQPDIDAIRHAAAVGCRALGMTSSPAHVEIILTADGPRIVEIGARNGGYRERMHALANGIDITANALALSLDLPLDISPKRNDCVGVFELFPKTPGIFQGIAHEDQLRKLPSFHYLSVKVSPGQLVGKAADGHKMCAVVILANKDSSQFRTNTAFLGDYVSIRTVAQPSPYKRS